MSIRLNESNFEKLGLAQLVKPKRKPSGSHCQAHTSLVRLCLDWLRLMPNCVAWQSSTSGIVRQGKGGKMFRAKSGVCGQPDITGIIGPNGRYFAVECKTGKGKQTPDQAAWQAKVESMGGKYWLVRSLDELMQLWRHKDANGN